MCAAILALLLASCNGADEPPDLDPAVEAANAGEPLGEWVPDHPHPLGQDRTSGARLWHDAVTLRGGARDGEALICGGTDQNPFAGFGGAVRSLPTCGRYDTGSGTWSAAEPVSGMPALSSFAFAPVGGGRAVVFGGTENGVSRPSDGTWLYDPELDGFAAGARGATPPARAYADAVGLPDGRALLFGGWTCAFVEQAMVDAAPAWQKVTDSGDCRMLDDVWVYEPGERSAAGDVTGTVGTWRPLAAPSRPRPEPRAFHMMAPMDDGRVLLYGGAVDGFDRFLGDTWVLDIDDDRANWTPLRTSASGTFGMMKAANGTLTPLGGDRFLLTLGQLSFWQHGMQSWVLDAAAATWTKQGPTVWSQGGRDYQAAFPVAPGRVMMVAGQGNDSVPSSDANLFCLDSCGDDRR